MKIHNVLPGSEEWHALRARCRCASEAPAVMGASRHLSRQDLVRMKALGLESEFSDYVQKHILDKGHEIEAAARAIVEARLGEALFPAVVTDDDERNLSSLDGMDMGETFLFECKSWNTALAAMLERGEVDDPHYYWQLEHQLMTVPQAERGLFTVSDGTEENTKWIVYERVPGRREELIAAWDQFEQDVANYVHVADPVRVVGKTMESLPMLVIEIEGKVIGSNLEPFRERASELIASINTNLQSDEDFANAEQAVKFCKDGEERLDLVKAQAIAKMASIDELFRTIDEISAQLRAKRLELGGLVSTRKETIRAEIAQGGKADFEAHIAALNARLGRPYMPTVKTDFNGAIKGKKTVKSLRDAVAGELARAKIEANRIADGIQINLNYLREHAKDHVALFPDVATIVLKAHDDLVALATNRINAHKAEQERVAREAEEKRQREEQERADKAQRELEQQHAAMRARGEYPTFGEAVAAAEAGARLQVRRMPQDQWHACAPGEELNAHCYYRKAPEEAAPAEAAKAPAAAPVTYSPLTSTRSTAAGSTVTPLRPAAKATRPSDEQIIGAVAAHFDVSTAVATDWLWSMVFQAPAHA